MRKIKHINGTSESSARCHCQTWKNHWSNFNPDRQNWPSYCVIHDCHRQAEVGAHVQKADSADDRWYIIPICKEHNLMTNQMFEVSDYVSFAPANQMETCGKEEFK